MRSRHGWRRAAAVCTIAASLGVLALPLAAQAATAEPSLVAGAWWWKSQQSQNVTLPVGQVSGELPNPYCPTNPGQGLGSPTGENCVEGRLPVEVIGGDYSQPDKVSALAFDMSAAVGGKVQSFTLQLLEAESGCMPDENTPTKQRCEQTDAVNPEGKQVQACLVPSTDPFGDTEARPYGQMPKFECTGASPFGVRKEVKNDDKADPNDPDADHVWTFDLTSYAQTWAKQQEFVGQIMLRPAKPKKAEDDDQNWRVVFYGPKVQDGIVTSLKYTPPATPPPPPPPTDPTDPTLTDPGTVPTGGTSTTTTTGSDLGGTGTATPGGAPAGGSGGETPSDTAAPEEAGTEAASAEIPGVEAMPAYMWLAIIAGLVGFSLVRSVVLDQVVGHRPDGVLAQIHKLNAARGGGAAAAGAAASAGPLAAFGAGVKSGLGAAGRAVQPVTSKIGSVVSKITSFRKG